MAYFYLFRSQAIIFLKSTYIFLVLVAILHINYEASASAWLPKAGSYKYGFSLGNPDSLSLKGKKNRAIILKECEQEINFLTRELKEIPVNSVRYIQIQTILNSLNKQKELLSSYQDEKLYSTHIEYGISNQTSFGIRALYKNNKFASTKSKDFSADIFYKIKLLHKDRYIFSLQPKIYIDKNSFFDQELFYEVNLLAGHVTKKEKISLIIDNSLSFCRGGNRAARKKQYYSFATSQIFKFPHEIMLINFSKYYIRKNYNPIYSRTIYEQVSVAKKINFSTVNSNNLTMQIGYFWDRSLNYPNYKISGTVFSVWIEI